MSSEPVIRLAVDACNPGQFFACCGLLELADRLWPGAEGWFDEGAFCVAAPPGAAWPDLLAAATSAELCQLDADDDMSSPIEIGPPFRLRLDWWNDQRAGGKALKVWAGSMRNVRIARAMRQALCEPRLATADLLNHSQVVYDPLETAKKVEPFYFDARRGANALPVDVGFAPDALEMTTAAYPAVEFFCLVGLQRARPAATDTPRVFRYFTWSLRLPVGLVGPAAQGLLPAVGARGRQFENAFRTSQRKHKSFLPATPLGGDT